MTCSSHVAQTSKVLLFHQHNIENRSIRSFWMFLQWLDPIAALDDLTNSCGSKAAALSCIRTMSVRSDATIWTWKTFHLQTSLASRRNKELQPENTNQGGTLIVMIVHWSKGYDIKTCLKQRVRDRCDTSLTSHCLPQMGQSMIHSGPLGCPKCRQPLQLAWIRGYFFYFLPFCEWRSPLGRSFIVSSFPGKSHAVCFCIASVNF